MLFETLLEKYYLSALNVFGSCKHILANYSFWSEENCFLHSVWKMSDGNFSLVKEKLQDVEITPQNVTNQHFWWFFHYSRKKFIKNVCSNTVFYCKFCCRIRICVQLDSGNTQRCHNYHPISFKFHHFVTLLCNFGALWTRLRVQKFKTDNAM